MHVDDAVLAGFLDKTLSKKDRRAVEAHLISCRQCRDTAVSAYDTLARFKKNRKINMRQKINPYLVLAILFFMLSFFIQRFLIQSLVATIIFGIKWVADSRSAKMLVMVYDAWKRGDEDETSRLLGSLEKNNRLLRSVDRDKAHEKYLSRREKF